MKLNEAVNVFKLTLHEISKEEYCAAHFNFKTLNRSTVVTERYNPKECYLNDFTMPLLKTEVRFIDNASLHNGIIEEIMEKDGNIFYIIRLANGNGIRMQYNNNIFIDRRGKIIQIKHLYKLPDFMLSWLDSPINRKKATESGFYVFRREDTGEYLLGTKKISDNQWTKLYLDLNLQWHSEKQAHILEVFERKLADKEMKVYSLQDSINEKESIRFIQRQKISLCKLNMIKSEIAHNKRQLKKIKEQINVYRNEVLPILKNIL